MNNIQKEYLKCFRITLGLVLVVVLASCATEEQQKNTENEQSDEDIQLSGSYSIHVGGYDWGPGVDQVIVEFNEVLDEVPNDELIINETKEVIDSNDAGFSVVEETFEREITNAYFVDETGEQSESPTHFVAFDLYVGPEEGNPLLFTEEERNAWSDPYYLTFSIEDGGNLLVDEEKVTDIEIEQNIEEKTTAADDFEYDSFESTDSIVYDYAHFSPEEDTDTLVVWLHGGGEGAGPGVENTDPSIPLLANKATILANSEFQNAVDNAHILVPQSPTMWLDGDGENNRTMDGTSYYEESLKELIDYYKKEIGAKKVVLAGPSNGGYMTLRLAVLYPDAFDVLVPIAEGYKDENLTDEELDSIKHIPMFFIYSENDEVLPPKEHTIPTVNRLHNIDAEEVRVSSTDSVIDTSNKYTNKDGNPYQYDGHWSWIYFYNNESTTDDDGTHVFEWINGQLVE